MIIFPPLINLPAVSMDRRGESPRRENLRIACSRSMELEATGSVVLPINDRLLGGQWFALLSSRPPREPAKLGPVCEPDVPA